MFFQTQATVNGFMNAKILFLFGMPAYLPEGGKILAFSKRGPFFSKVRASSLLLYMGSKAGIELYSSLRAKIIPKTTLKHQNNSEQMLNAMVTYHRRLPNTILLNVNESSWRHSQSGYATSFEQNRKIIHLTHEKATLAILFPNVLFLFWDNLLGFSAIPAFFLPRTTLPLVERGWNGEGELFQTASFKVNICLSLRAAEKIIHLQNVLRR